MNRTAQINIAGDVAVSKPRAEQRQLMVIVNPVAGCVARHKADVQVFALASELGYEVDLRHTRRAGDATDFARQAVDACYYGVIAVGGDGTVNEVARGLCGSRVAMGIVPLGSVNGLARHLGLPLTVSGAMKAIGEDRVIEGDYGSANGRPFFCTFGMGFDAAVTDRFEHLPTRGLKTYLRSALDEILKFKSERYTIIANGRTITEDAMLVAVCNASQYGNNAFIAPRASIKDGLLDVTIIHKGNLVEQALVGIDMLSGNIDNNAKVSAFRARRLTILRSGEGAAHYDGEAARIGERVEIECHPGQLRLFATARKHRLRAIVSPQIPFVSSFLLLLRDIRFRIYNLFH